jgi:hypothetical protein
MRGHEMLGAQPPKYAILANLWEIQKANDTNS